MPIIFRSLLVLIACEQLVCETLTKGLLYPRESESRAVRLLDGLWQCLRCDDTDALKGVRETWYKDELKKIATTISISVPASYNDLFVEKEWRDHVGTVWYERKFFVHHQWTLDKRVWLRFGSVHYSAIVWLNGKEIMRHSIGHLPFEAEITSHLKYNSENRLTVMCDNRLTNITIPQGDLIEETINERNITLQTYTFDFFNYAGIHRSVMLYTTPKVFIQDIHIVTDLKTADLGIVHYNISIDGYQSNELFKTFQNSMYLHLQLLDKAGTIVINHICNKSEMSGSFQVANVHAWWPFLMHENYGYLYTLEIYLHAPNNDLLDVYRLPFGVRRINWYNNTINLNGQRLYLKGFGRHEDSDIKGKGFDLPLLIRDFNLLKWIGANVYRTSHYPYSEESMQLADENGIMIINECSSVNTDFFSAMLLLNHKTALEQLIHRDRNHPSVIMWSVANEPRTAKEKSGPYFSKIVSFVKSLDNTRPVTAAINAKVDKDYLAKLLDVISFNRYNSWYHNSGHLDMITNNVINEAKAWHKQYQKPIIMTEYGADAIEGLHALPAFMWSEEYQLILMYKHFKAFDKLRSQGWFIGELVWNFADFKTDQNINRVGGNKKGIFTRNRQPKAAAHILRQRYYMLSQYNVSSHKSDDIYPYIIDNEVLGFMQKPHTYEEL